MMCFVVLICELVVLRNGGMLAVVLFCWLDLTCGFVCGCIAGLLGSLVLGAYLCWLWVLWFRLLGLLFDYCGLLLMWFAVVIAFGFVFVGCCLIRASCLCAELPCCIRYLWLALALRGFVMFLVVCRRLCVSWWCVAFRFVVLVNC